MILKSIYKILAIFCKWIFLNGDRECQRKFYGISKDWLNIVADCYNIHDVSGKSILCHLPQNIVSTQANVCWR